MHGDDVSGLRYEVMYLMHADDDNVPEFKRTLGRARRLDRGRRRRRPLELPRAHQRHRRRDRGRHRRGPARRRSGSPTCSSRSRSSKRRSGCRSTADDAAAPVEHVTTAVVAVAVGDGLRRLFASLGVQQVVAGGQSMNPSTAQILEAVELCAADGVIVLPNNKNIVPVARQVPDLTERPVGVVPTAAVVEALSAMVVYDADASLDDNVATMQEAAERVRCGEVTQAVRDSSAECGPIKTGDWIAITRDGVHAATQSAVDARDRARRRARRRRLASWSR